MVVSNQLKKQIIIECIALLFLIGVIIYAFFAIQKSNENKVVSQDGLVIVLDDSKYKGVFSYSDGEGLNEDGITYTLTNNNLEKVSYKVIIYPDVLDEEILKQVRISMDDLYIESLVDLEEFGDGYVIAEDTLKAGYTNIHLIKIWYKLNTSKKILSTDINFDFKLVMNKEVNGD